MIYATQIIVWVVAIGLPVAFYFLYRYIRKTEQDHEERISALEKTTDDMVGLYLVRSKPEPQPKVEKVYLSKRKKK